MASQGSFENVSNASSSFTPASPPVFRPRPESSPMHPNQHGPNPPTQFSTPSVGPPQPDYAVSQKMQNLSLNSLNSSYGPQAPAPQSSKPRVNPSQMPKAVSVQQADQKLYVNSPFHTNLPVLPPCASSFCKIIDDGNASPRFIRSTTYSFPVNSDINKLANVPLGFIVEPFPSLPLDEVKHKLILVGSFDFCSSDDKMC
jgi:protein transport protein SEC24